MCGSEVETLRMETRRLTNELKAAAAAINLQEKVCVAVLN